MNRLRAALLRVGSTWNRFWFEPSSATHLAFARIVFYWHVYRMAGGLVSPPWYGLSKLVWKPISFFEIFHLRPFEPRVLGALDSAFVVLAVLCLFGVLTRITTVLCILVALYLVGLTNDFGKVSHGWSATIVMMTVFTFTRAGDKWSVDALLRRFVLKRPLPVPERSGEYTWPIRAAWLVVTLMYFSAGLSKLHHSGIQWALSDNLRWLLIRHQYSHHPPTKLGLWVANHEDLSRALGCMSLGLELAAPLMLVHRYLRAPIALGLFGMQMSIALMMGVVFDGALYCFFIFFVPWGTLLDAAEHFARLKLRAVPAESNA